MPEYGGNLFNIDGIEDRVRVNISDVRDQYSLCHLVKGQDVLFNLAGQTSHMDSMARPEIDLDINCKAQLSILEASDIITRRSASFLAAPGRFMASRGTFLWTKIIRLIRWM